MKLFLTFAMIFLAPGFLRAWSGPGHMIVAAIAYRALSPQQRLQVAEILKNHDNAAKWEAEVPENDPALDEGIVFIMGASKWPDEIKRTSSPWNHREWHYVDYPLTPPVFALKPSPAPGNDIVFAITLCVKNLKDPAVPAKDKANWLAWLIHLVGDITQPLHCCALVNDNFAAPDGDRGGNLVFVRAGSGKGVPLHKMWDDAPGTSQGFHAKLLRRYVNKAAQLGEQWKRGDLEELAENTTPQAWARESWRVAVDQVYLQGQLHYGKDAQTAVVLPEDYTKNLKAVAVRRVTLAGYRLADLIQDALKTSRSPQ